MELLISIFLGKSILFFFSIFFFPSFPQKVWEMPCYASTLLWIFAAGRCFSLLLRDIPQVGLCQYHHVLHFCWTRCKAEHLSGSLRSYQASITTSLFWAEETSSSGGSREKLGRGDPECLLRRTQLCFYCLFCMSNPTLQI